MRLSAIFEPQRFVTEQSRGAQSNRRFGERKRYSLEPRERRAECLALCHIRTSLLDALLGSADTHQANQRTAEIKSLHHVDEARAFRADTRGRWYADAVEKKLAAPDCARAHVSKARSRHAHRVEIYVECAHAASGLFNRAGPSQDEGGICRR